MLVTVFLYKLCDIKDILWSWFLFSLFLIFWIIWEKLKSQKKRKRKLLKSRRDKKKWEKILEFPSEKIEIFFFEKFVQFKKVLFWERNFLIFYLVFILKILTEHQSNNEICHFIYSFFPKSKAIMNHFYGS